MKHDIQQNGMLAAVMPLFLLFILYILKIFGVRHGLDTSHDWEYIRWNSGACSVFSLIR